MSNTPVSEERGGRGQAAAAADVSPRQLAPSPKRISNDPRRRLWSARPSRPPAKPRLLLAALICGAGLAYGAESSVLYRNDFSQDEVGKKPDGMIVLDGAFAVRAEADNRFLELPGAPLETYGVLFGPAQNQGAPSVRGPNEPLDTQKLSVTARVFGTRRGRRFPTFAVGLGGVGGYRLQVSPGKRELELFRGETDQASLPFEWTSGQWLWLKLQVRRIKEGEWRVEGKVWPEGAQPPTEWTIDWTDTETPKPGRASLWGSPFADTPIRFDDLSIERSP